jgi:hypothetical protein
MSGEAPALRIAVRLTLPADGRELLADARALEAAAVDAIWVESADADPYVALAAIAAVTWRVGLVAAGAPDGAGRTTCEALANGRLAAAEDLELRGERWIRSDFPDGKDAWRALRADALSGGAAGIVIPNDPRLIDLLRNPDETIDRADLNLATG